ncbi:uncharacterized protein LOC110108143 [Dendrobium catenatum]|uniref:uncharacterized protein LOC110108143 n=1 Tax=Dendrobium catenatum TaxID=906689 RepID=UPI0010A03ECA|nr:uncharacterized protein LOC110108143 [Dendrobium catenatum]
MAGVLGSCSSPLIRPLQRRHSPRRCFMVSAELSESSAPSPSSAVVEGEGGSSSSSATFPSSPPPSFSPAAGFKPPQPKPFSVRSDKFLDILGASLALPFRLGTGAFVQGYSASLVSKDQIPPNEYALSIAGFKLKETSRLGPRPEKPIEIYEFESCPFCRKVREIVSILDLDILFYPCPKNGPNFRPKVLQMGGKQQFPYMVDPNTGVSMYESDDIIKYLVTKYGDGTVPLMLSLGLITTLTEGFAMIGRMGKGSSYSPSRLPPMPLELWAYEPSPFCKIVREVLVELELPHLLHRYRYFAQLSTLYMFIYSLFKSLLIFV